MEAPATPNAVGRGTVLGGTYEIENELGGGGMGLVFAARHVRTQKRVAIKILREAPGPEMLARFRQEAEIATRLGHPNIIRVDNFDTLPSGTAYLVMELLEGESLAARARRGPMTVDEALPIVRQIGSALHAAHGAGVIHRDLKPENVFLVKQEASGRLVDRVKILDFGISKVLGGSAVHTRNDVALGTPRYMAPEQASGRNSELDGRVDQFALAVIAFELLAGRPPFDGDDGTRVMFKIVNDPPSPLAPLAPDAPPAVVAAIERALSKRPRDRFRDVSEFIGALTGTPLVPTSPEPLEPMTVRERRSSPEVAPAPIPVVASPGRAQRGWLAAILVGTAVLATALAIAWTMTRRPASSADAIDAAMPAPPPSPPIDAAPVPVVVVSIDAAIEVADAAPMPPDAPRVRVTTSPRTAPPEPPTSPELADAIAQAETAFREARFDDAGRLAKRALNWGRSPRIFAVLLDVACHNHDLEAVYAALRNLSQSSWPAARARCAKLGFPIESPNP